MTSAEFAAAPSPPLSPPAALGGTPETSGPFENFDQACRAVLARLRADTGMAMWAFTRTDGNNWLLLSTDGGHEGLPAGARLPWQDSLCARMSRGGAPHAAPDVLKEPLYRDAPLLRDAPIRAYIGVPLQRSDGSLYGTLCGFDPSPRGPELAAYLPQVRLQSRLLGTLLEHDLELAEIVRRAERAELESLADPLTGAYNRRGWMRLLKAEDARCRRYGHGAGVLMADLDNLKIINDTLGHDAGDALLVRAARALGSVVRHGDAVARIGGDEFAVLAIDVGAMELDQLAMRADAALREAEVEATLGTGLRDRDQSLAQAYRQADLAMLQLKHGKRARLRAAEPGEPGKPGLA
ncbi:MAG TPA: sensor domain-containing diguanylate cyclase [Rhodanobacteraceae bacterium]|nr:sensor domain-containing diguanylate cyclase [Rhodanobacteraceae bacterium]